MKRFIFFPLSHRCRLHERFALLRPRDNVTRLRRNRGIERKKRGKEIERKKEDRRLRAVHASLISLTSPGNLVSCLKELMRACGLVSFARGNSLHDKSLTSPRGSYPANGFMKYGRVNDFESDTIPISSCDSERLN